MRAELLKLSGVLAVVYHADQDRFAVRYESVLVSLETIFAAIANAGRMLGQAYFPEVVPSPAAR